MESYEYGFDRSEYLLQIVRQFNTKPDKRAIERVYRQLIAGLDKELNEQNKMVITEKKRILMECYKMFRNEEIFARLRNVNPRAIKLNFQEEILGIKKRSFDRSNMFDQKKIATKISTNGTQKEMIALEDIDGEVIPIIDENGREYTIKPIGRLIYQSRS